MRKSSLLQGIIKGGLVALIIAGGCSKGQQGPMGPPGLLPPGTIKGTVTLWKDYGYYHREREAGGVEVSLEGLSEYRDTTKADGTYTLENVSAGIYTIVARKEGYGTMKQYNFSVGGGTSYFSPALWRIAQPPRSVTAQPDTVELDNNLIPAIKISWIPADTLWHVYQIYYSPEISFEETKFIGQVLTARPSSVFVYNLPAGEYYFGVRADNGVYYVDESSGELVFPTLSRLTRTTEKVRAPETQGSMPKLLIPPVAKK